jgi:hypothetical protein
VALRDKLNEYPGATAAGVGVIIVATIVLIVFSLRGEGGRTNGPKWLPDKAFFTDDEGKTHFVDDLTKIPPFQHNGRNAYRAQVFIDSNERKFVGFMESYDPATKAKIESDLKSGKPIAEVLSDNPPEVKKPGGGGWVKPNKNGKFSYEYLQVMKVPSPDKKTTIQPVHVTSEDVQEGSQ